MRSSGEMRCDAWRVMKGKWFWRLLAVAIVLQVVAYSANLLVSQAFSALSITEIGDYVAAKISAAQQGLSYSLPTTKAYCWMYCGLCFQMFIAYIFGAIFAFGFMGLLLKARADDDNHWFTDSFGGFSRPLDVTWLLFLMNLRIALAALPGAFLGGLAAGICYPLLSGGPFAMLGIGVIVAVAGALSLGCALRAVYAFRQAWFIKNEKPETPASRCLAESRQMMEGHKMQAFALDVSFLGWILLAVAMYICSAVFGLSAQNFGAAAAGVSFFFGVAFFYLLVKVILGIAVSRAVFYRDLQSEMAADAAKGGE
ncbi:MAG: DUF975 family protein [Kiritimatiellae bacterium]|nr:DUF975 family protein [Kiritimatiellia bacterium]